jgi:thiamine biosynthesis lipoprotein
MKQTTELALVGPGLSRPKAGRHKAGPTTGPGSTSPRICYLLVAALALAGCRAPPNDEPVVFDGLTMGTTYTVKVTPPLPVDRAELAAGIAAVLDEVDGRMSTYKPDSELSRLNTNPGLDWLPISAPLADILGVALDISRLTDGAYDISVGPLVNLWGFGPGDRPRQAPDEATLAATRQRVGYKFIELDAHTPALRKHAPDLYLDLSSIAQGFGSDAVGKYLSARGMANFMVDVSGEILARGVNAAGQPWHIGIERPVATEGTIERVIVLRDVAMATSGDYRNYFEQDGIRYSHLIDPSTGHPIAHRLASVSVLASTTTRADGMATALMILGPERGYELAMREKMPALFIMRTDSGFEERWTPFLEPYLQ